MEKQRWWANVWEHRWDVLQKVSNTHGWNGFHTTYLQEYLLFEALNGKKNRYTINYLPWAYKIEKVDKFKELRQELMQILKENICRAQNQMKDNSIALKLVY